MVRILALLKKAHIPTEDVERYMIADLFWVLRRDVRVGDRRAKGLYKLPCRLAG
jgi:hypothetical protein